MAKTSTNPLLERLKKTSTIKEAAVLADSEIFFEADLVTTDVPLLNVAQSGDFDGGFASGLTQWTGPSKHFKTTFCLVNGKAYLDKYEDAVLIFYDSEFGSPQSYFEACGIDLNRVLHVPIKNVEEFKFDIMKQLDEMKKGDHVMIIVDSVGNLASKKEVEDALAGSEKADMTRAKQFKSIGRMITPYLRMKDIPMHVVNHIYMTQEMFSKPVVGGGTGFYYAADNIFIVGRQQEKDGTELAGYNFVIKVEKSRFVREGSKFPITVLFDRGISKWSGMLDLAVEMGYVIKPKVGFYSRPSVKDDKNWRAAQTNDKVFWDPIFQNTDFAEKVSTSFKLAGVEMINTEDFSEE
jgi:RecA/RadA recombinase